MTEFVPTEILTNERMHEVTFERTDNAFRRVEACAYVCFMHLSCDRFHFCYDNTIRYVLRPAIRSFLSNY
jgi:hypothetical protein